MQQKIIFLHIPKTAGMSLLSIFGNKYDASEIVRVRYIKENINMKVDSENVTVVSGHFPFGFHNNFDLNAKYITFLRDPVDRVVSTYYFIKRSKNNRFHEKINSENISLKDFVLNDETFRDVYNLQTRFIAGINGYTSNADLTIEMYKKAIENLENHFIVIGLTERFDESVLMMKNELNWSYPVYLKQNMAKKKEIPKVSDEIRKLIVERNEYDIKLYDYVKEHFQNTIDQNKDKYEKQLRTFALLNSLYKAYKISKQTIKQILIFFFNK